jgi:enterobactin synthetase component D
MLTTLESFITSVKTEKLGTINGHIAYCQFFAQMYSDNLFLETKHNLPDDLLKTPYFRKAAYLAGRFLAECSLAKVGSLELVVTSQHNGAPKWPLGIIGSITHKGDKALCISIDHDSFIGVGIDMESLIPLNKLGWVCNSVFQSTEMNIIKFCGLPLEQAVTVGFSAKESLYKAISPILGSAFNFNKIFITEICIKEHSVKLIAPSTSAPNQFETYLCGYLYKTLLIITWCIIPSSLDTKELFEKSLIELL